MGRQPPAPRVAERRADEGGAFLSSSCNDGGRNGGDVDIDIDGDGDGECNGNWDENKLKWTQKTRRRRRRCVPIHHFHIHVHNNEVDDWAPTTAAAVAITGCHQRPPRLLRHCCLCSSSGSSGGSMV